MTNRDLQFISSIAEVYDVYLVPLIFAPYAVDVAARVAKLRPARVLELACGTGVVTRELAKVTSAAIVATDLNQPMIDRAIAVGTARPVDWRQADAMALPFGDGEFDVVVCQFGVMFFPDKGFTDARRVLRPGGTLVFDSWDSLAHNEVTDEIGIALAAIGLPGPGEFMARGPHGYHDVAAIRADLAAAGWGVPAIETIAKQTRAASAEHAAIAFTQGTPMRNQIPAERLAVATAVAKRAVAARWGEGPFESKIQAHVVVVGR